MVGSCSDPLAVTLALAPLPNPLLLLVDASTDGETETVDRNSGLVDLQSRKGKGRAASAGRPIGAAAGRETNHGVMPTPPPPATTVPYSASHLTLTFTVHWDNQQICRTRNAIETHQCTAT